MTTMADTRYSKKWVILAAVSAGAFMGTIDASIVNIALPTISRAFSLEVKTVSLTVISYLITITSLLLVTGRFGDIFGRKPVFILGIAVFTFGSFLCGMSVSFPMLVASRIIQALGGSMIAGNSAALITDNFPPNEKGKALGILGTVVSIGLTIGPPLGGIIIEHWGWRHIFWVNIPLGIAAVIVCVKTLPTLPKKNLIAKLDVRGIILLPLVMVSLIIGVNSLGRIESVNPTSITLISLSIVLAVMFYLHEKKTIEPLIDFNLLFSKRFFFSNIAGFISYFSLIFVIILIPFYNESILGLSAEESGKVLLTIPLVTMFLALLAGVASDEFGEKYIATAGLLIALFGTASLIGLGVGDSALQVIMRLAIIGVGLGLFTTPNNSAIIGAIPLEQRGLASGMIGTVRNLGMSLGVAVSTTFFTLWKEMFVDRGVALNYAFIKSFDRVIIIAVVMLVFGVAFSLFRGKITESSSVYPVVSK